MARKASDVKGEVDKTPKTEARASCFSVASANSLSSDFFLLLPPPPNMFALILKSEEGRGIER